MADLDEIERLDQEIRAAESNAMINLADHLRGAVRDIPSQSDLALYFVQHAKSIELLAGQTVYCDWTLRQLERDAGKLLGGEGHAGLREGDLAGPPAPSDERRRELEGARRDRALWEQTTAECRESLLLGVLGDERLIIRELTSRLNAQLCPDGGKGPYGKTQPVYEGNVRSLVKRMLRDGQLDREAETFNKTHVRYRYCATRADASAAVDQQEGGDA